MYSKLECLRRVVLMMARSRSSEKSRSRDETDTGKSSVTSRAASCHTPTHYQRHKLHSIANSFNEYTITSFSLLGAQPINYRDHYLTSVVSRESENSASPLDYLTPLGFSEEDFLLDSLELDSTPPSSSNESFSHLLDCNSITLEHFFSPPTTSLILETLQQPEQRLEDTRSDKYFNSVEELNFWLRSCMQRREAHNEQVPPSERFVLLTNMVSETRFL
jgi:hypothetical protein